MSDDPTSEVTADELEAREYLTLGHLLTETLYPARRAINDYNSVVASAKAQVLKCRFSPDPVVSLEEKAGNMRGTQFGQADAALLHGAAYAAFSAIEGEAAKRTTIPLRRNEVSGKLHDLKDSGNLNDVQEELREETVRCLECGAFRAAVVVGWNLAYDVIRQWAFDRDLSALNAGLQARRGNNHVAINHYDDLLKDGAPTEREFIDALHRRESGDPIDEKLHFDLVQKLNYRNQYAHVTSREATMVKSNGYLEQLVELITSDPFV